MEAVELKLIAESKRSGVVKTVMHAPLERELTYVQAYEIIQKPVLDDDGNPVLDDEGNPTYTEETKWLYNEDGTPMMRPDMEYVSFRSHPRQAMLPPEEEISEASEELEET